MKKPPMRVDVGAGVRKLRLAAGMSQGDMIELVSFDRSALSKIENGRKMPGITRIMEIAHALNMRPSEVIAAGEIEDIAR